MQPFVAGSVFTHGGSFYPPPSPPVYVQVLMPSSSGMVHPVMVPWSHLEPVQTTSHATPVVPQRSVRPPPTGSPPLSDAALRPSREPAFAAASTVAAVSVSVGGAIDRPTPHKGVATTPREDSAVDQQSLFAEDDDDGVLASPAAAVTPAPAGRLVPTAAAPPPQPAPPIYVPSHAAPTAAAVPHSHPHALGAGSRYPPLPPIAPRVLSPSTARWLDPMSAQQQQHLARAAFVPLPLPLPQPSSGGDDWCAGVSPPGDASLLPTPGPASSVEASSGTISPVHGPVSADLVLLNGRRVPRESVVESDHALCDVMLPRLRTRAELAPFLRLNSGLPGASRNGLLVRPHDACLPPHPRSLRVRGAAPVVSPEAARVCVARVGFHPQLPTCWFLLPPSLWGEVAHGSCVATDGDRGYNLGIVEVIDFGTWDNVRKRLQKPKRVLGLPGKGPNLRCVLRLATEEERRVREVETAAAEVEILRFVCAATVLQWGMVGGDAVTAELLSGIRFQFVALQADHRHLTVGFTADGAVSPLPFVRPLRQYSDGCRIYLHQMNSAAPDELEQ